MFAAYALIALGIFVPALILDHESLLDKDTAAISTGMAAITALAWPILAGVLIYNTLKDLFDEYRTDDQS